MPSALLASPIHFLHAPRSASEPSTISSITPLISPLAQRAQALQTSAVIVSPSLPPVSAKAAEKIVKQQLVEVKELMPDNSALMLQLTELGPSQSASAGKLREIDLFAVFFWPSQEGQGAGHLWSGDRSLGPETWGRGWQAYDRLFRQQNAAGANHPWAKLCPSLMAATVMAPCHSGKGQSCLLCNGSDHDQYACALVSA